MKYKLRVRLGGGTLLERTVEADQMEIRHSAAGTFQATALGRKALAIVAMRYPPPPFDSVPTTEFECLVTLEEDPD